jgi:hypothetical protein
MATNTQNQGESRDQQNDELHEALKNARRQRQRKEAEIIGAGGIVPPRVTKISVNQALNRFVFVSNGSRVVDLTAPRFCLSYPDWANTFKASTFVATDADGNEKTLQVSDEWMRHINRVTVSDVTFYPRDGQLYALNPNGVLCANTWQGFNREHQVSDEKMARLIGIFLTHINHLFPVPQTRERFLDWLAHTEQKPWELPHTAFLHIAQQTGMGRNWLSGLLARVFAGYTAASLDLSLLLKSGWGDSLTSKVMCVVDEIHAGGTDNPWSHAEKMKQLLNEPTRTINSKYGRIVLEHNAARWLLFSNHLAALPLDRNDRRVEVEILPLDTPIPNEAYFTAIYNAYDDPDFIASVARWLSKRDISQFNPGARATFSEAKSAAVNSTESDLMSQTRTIQEVWPFDVISSQNLTELVAAASGFGTYDKIKPPAFRHVTNTLNIVAGKNPVCFKSELEDKTMTQRVRALRNADQYVLDRTNDTVIKPLEDTEVLLQVVYGTVLGDSFHRRREALKECWRLVEGNKAGHDGLHDVIEAHQRNAHSSHKAEADAWALRLFTVLGPKPSTVNP